MLSQSIARQRRLFTAQARRSVVTLDHQPSACHRSLRLKSGRWASVTPLAIRRR